MKKWSDVTADPRYQSAAPELQERIRNDFFTNVIAPDIPEDVDASEIRRQFDIKTDPMLEKPSFLSAVKDRALENKQLGLDIIDSVFGEEKSVVAGKGVDNTPAIERRGGPLSEEGFAKVKGSFENADEAGRDNLTKRPGAIGNAARKLDEAYQQADAKAPDRITDRRIESREKRLLQDGLTPETARAVSAQGGDVNTISKITPGIPDREIVDYALDTVRDVAKIAPQTGKMVIDTARLSGEYIPIVGDILTRVSAEASAAIEEIAKRQSPELQAKSRELQMMMQTGDRAQVTAFLAKNPSVMSSIAIPSAGSMLVAAGPGITLRAIGASAEAATTATVASNALMNAGSAFSEAQGDPVARYTAALIAGGGTLLIGRLTEGGAEGAIARGLSGGGKSVASRLSEGAKVAGREYAQEFVEGGSEATGTQVADVMSGTRDSINPQQILNQAQVEGAAGLLLGGGVGMLQTMQQDQKQQASEEAQAALDAIPNANTVDEAIALFNETIKAPITVNTPPLFQEPITNAVPAEAIDAAELVEGLPAEGEPDVSLANDVAPVPAGVSGLESDLGTGSVGDRLNEQPGDAAALDGSIRPDEPVLRNGSGDAAVTFANAQEGQIVDSGGQQFRKVGNGFERVDVNPEQSTPVESQIQPDMNVNETPNITRAQAQQEQPAEPVQAPVAAKTESSNPVASQITPDTEVNAPAASAAPVINDSPIRAGDVFRASNGEAITVTRALPGGKVEVRIQGKRLRVGDWTSNQLKKLERIGRAEYQDGIYYTPESMYSDQSSAPTAGNNTSPAESAPSSTTNQDLSTTQQIAYIGSKNSKQVLTAEPFGTDGKHLAVKLNGDFIYDYDSGEEVTVQVDATLDDIKKAVKKSGQFNGKTIITYNKGYAPQAGLSQPGEAPQTRWPVPKRGGFSSDAQHQGAVAAVEFQNGDIDKAELIARLGSLGMEEAVVEAVTYRLQDDWTAADTRAVMANGTADKEDARKAEIEIARSNRAKAMIAERMKLNPSTDDLFAAMAKLGGLKKDDAVSEFGLDPADLGKYRSGLLFSFTNGKRALNGYDVGDTVAEFGDKLDNAIRGIQQERTQEDAAAEKIKAFEESQQEYSEAYDALSEADQETVDEIVDAAIAAIGDAQVSAIMAEVATENPGESVNTTFFRTQLKERINDHIAAQEARKQAGANAEAEAGRTAENRGGESGVSPDDRQEVGSDLFGDSTATQQSLADAARAKDTKRNSGESNPDDFTLAGSDRAADQAIARGARDLFDQPDEVSKAKEALNAAGVTGTDKLNTIAQVRDGKLTAEEVAEAHGVELDDRDHFTLERLNRDTDKMESVTFERGEYVRYQISGNDNFGEIDGISHSRREFSVDGLWYPFGFAYKAERPASIPDEDAVPLSGVIDDVNAKHGEGLDYADRIHTLAVHKDLFSRVYEGNATADELKASFDGLLKNKDAIIAELNGMTKPKLFEEYPGLAYRYKNDKKDVVVEAVYRNMMDEFTLDNSISYSFGEKYENVIRRIVDNVSDEELTQFAEKVKRSREERKAALAERTAGMQNPQTLEDYTNLLRGIMAEGKTLGEARMSLTPEQREQYDTLAATKIRGERMARKDSQKTAVQATVTTTTGDIIETKHTKTGEDLFVVKAAERVERDVYNQWNTTAKRLGGWYSSFRGNGAVPGFQFKTRESAEAFLQYLGGDVEQAKEALQARRDTFADDRSQSAVERLNEMADKLEERADASLGQERKANTARRARFAASAEAAASGDKAMAQTMRNIASGIENGTVQLLDQVRQKVQVEMLQGMVRTAHDEQLRKLYPSYADLEKHRGEKPTKEVADFVTYPAYTAYRSDLASLGRKLLETEGTKKLGQRIMSVADDVTEAYLKFARENLHKVSRFSVTGSSAPAVFPSKAEAEKVIARSGFNGKAIVLPFKRGQNIIILSPSEAMKHGIWEGDNDKRITLSGDFGEELVEKLGKVNRSRGRNTINVPWQFENAYDKRKRLAGMGIETPQELRAAIREFVELREAPKEADKIKQMERAMIGRRNDGLDFFPTPASVADEMIESADLKEGMAVLEPSAGMGHIADRIREAGIDPDVVELSGDRRELLQEKGFNIVGHDFMDVQSETGYDRIIMNPPFGDRRDAAHVQHAYELLKPGGRIVAIMGEGVFFGQDKKAQAFRDWLEQVGASDEKLEEGTFLDPSLPVNTAVNARMVVIDKADDVKFSRGDAQPSGITLDKFKQELATSFGEKTAEKLIASGVIVPLKDQTQLPAHVVPFLRTGDIVFGFYDPKTNRTYAVLENLTPDMIKGLTLHEVGTHYGIKKMLGESKYQEVMNRLDTLRRAGSKEIKKAYAEASANAVNEKQVPEETLAYLVQNHPTMSIIKDVIARIKAFLFREFGIAGKYLNEDDLTMLAKAAVNYAAWHEQQGSSESRSQKMQAAFQRVWHGSPHIFDKFSLDAIGTGEGAQAYGWGLYFAGKKGIAEHYRKGLTTRDLINKARDAYDESFDPDEAVEALLAIDGLSESQKELILALQGDDWLGFDYPHQAIAEAIKRPDQWDLSPRARAAVDKQGQLYEVEIPEDDTFLLWDKPLSEQPEKVKAAIIAADLAHPDSLEPNPARVSGTTGKDLYEGLARKMQKPELAPSWTSVSSDSDGRAWSGQEAASKNLHSLGINGIKYLDGSSRNAGDGSYNYVLFDDNAADIVQTHYSRENRQPSSASGDTLVTAAMEYLARDPELFQRPLTEVKDIYGIAKEIDPGYRVERLGPSMTKDRKADRAWEVFVPGSNVRSGVIMTNAEEVWIDVSRLQSGLDSGSAIYDMAAAYAHNNSKVLIGDPLGLSRMAYYRRNENMLSSALKYGTTRHLRPHLAQEIPSEYFTGHEKAFGESVRPLNWIEGDDVNNIREMIYNSWKAAIDNVPELKDVIYDPATQQFQYVDGRPFTDQDSERIAAELSRASRPYRAGSATQKRAALFNTFLRSEGREGRKQVLGALVDQLSRGGLSPALKDVFYSRSNPQQGSFNPSWDAPEPSKFDNLIYTLQDKNIDLKRVTQEIQKTGNEIDDRWNAYLQEELYHGRTAKRTQDFIREELDPLVADMQERKVTLADFEEYLWMRHAEERNAQIAKVNPEMPDSGSGVSTAEAQEYLDSLSDDKRADYEALAARIDSINAKSRQLLIDYGLESMSTIKAWQDTYKHYVPLMREEMDHGFGNGTGQGFSVRGNAAKRATGSKRAVVDILANIAMQREKNIIRGEKNRVATALIGLAKLNPNPEFWNTDTVPQIKDIGKDGLVTYRPDPNYKGRENVIVARIVNKQGKIVEHSVIFNQFDERAQRMAASLKNLDQDQIGELLGVASSFTRYFASINTQYNPVFGAINITRDVQGALFNLESTPLAGKQKEVTRLTGSALKGIYQEIRAVRKGKKADTKWAQLWEEFQREGGKTGFRDMYRNAKVRGEALEHAIDPEWWQKEKWGRVVSVGGVLAAPQQWLVSKPGKALFDWLSDYNDTLENSVRLAAYKVALDQGLSKQQSASIAKNLTVNFNRKGEMGRQIGSLYAFFNASVQGTARIGETLFKEGKMTRAGKQIIGGGMLLGGMQALMLAFAGFDDEEPPEFVRDRNLVIPIGNEKYITIPMPLGYNAIPATGRILTEWAMDGFDDTQHRFAHLLEVYMDMFNPIGYSGISMQTLAPTALDPFAALAENKDWTGRQIAREDFSSLNPTPGFTRSKDTASSISKGMSYSLNWMTGGTDYTPGVFSPTPDQIDYLIGQFTGGVGREYMKLEQTASSMVTGDELPTYKIPLVGRFYGNASGQTAQGGKFYDNLIRMNKHSNEIKGRMENGGDVDAYLAENPEAELADYATSTYSAISKLRKQRNQAKEEGSSKAELKEIDQEITDLMREFNDEVRKIKDGAPA